MTSKWITQLKKKFDLVELYDSDEVWMEMENTLTRVDALLFRAMLSVEDQTLSDEIEDELNGTG